MTPKEKALDLIDKMYSISGVVRFSKGYAIICVDEILNAICNDDFNGSIIDKIHAASYWNEVKKEIQNF